MDVIAVESIELSRSVVRREPLENLTEALSGARLERIVLADGRTLILKRLPAEGDWLTRATRGAGRLWRLWASGLLARVEPFVEHMVIDVQRVDGTDLVVMCDATEVLLPPRAPVSRDTSRALLVQLAAFHEAFRDQAGEGLCSVGARYAMFAPAFHAADAGPGHIRSPIGLRAAGNCSRSMSTATSSTRCSPYTLTAESGSLCVWLVSRRRCCTVMRSLRTWVCTAGARRDRLGRPDRVRPCRGRSRLVWAEGGGAGWLGPPLVVWGRRGPGPGGFGACGVGVDGGPVAVR